MQMMQTKENKKTKEKPVEKKDPDFSPIVASGVLAMLGKPTNLQSVVVKHLWNNRYRVNIWCEIPNDYDGQPMLRIMDSFFVWSDEVGDIVKISPEITIKKYTSDNPTAVSNIKKKFSLN